MNKKIQLSDEVLIEKMINGDPAAFNALYARYKDRLLYYFYRMLGNSNEKAQDFLQEIFMKIIDKVETFDRSRKFSTWIFSIAHNMCKNEYRRMDSRTYYEIESISHLALEEDDQCFDLGNINLEQFITDLFNELETFDEIHKSAFLLRYREDFSMKDISQTLEISEGTVKSRLFYTRQRLAERLAHYQYLQQ